MLPSLGELAKDPAFPRGLAEPPRLAWKGRSDRPAPEKPLHLFANLLPAGMARSYESWLHVKWSQFVALFGTSKDCVQLVNAAAPLFFRVLQDTLWHDTLLHLCRITDQPEHRGDQRLSIKLLPSLIEDASLAHDLQSLIEDANAKTKFARDWRNKRLAHSDLRVALTEGVKPLAPASREDVKLALAAIGAVLNRVEDHFRDAEVCFDRFPYPGDAESLLYVLRDGLEVEKQRQARMRDGRPTDDDLRPPRPI